VANRFIATISLVVGSARDRFRVALIGGFALSFLGVTRATGDVDFLAEATGSDILHDALTTAGFVAKYRTENVANYAPPSVRFAPVDFLFSRRPATLAMLERATAAAVPHAPGLTVSSIDAEGIIGLKIQAIANDPTRRRQDEADILSLLRANMGTLDLDLIGSYFRTFEMSADLDRLLKEARGS
jgi:hypothetical protein